MDMVNKFERGEETTNETAQSHHTSSRFGNQISASYEGTA